MISIKNSCTLLHFSINEKIACQIWAKSKAQVFHKIYLTQIWVLVISYHQFNGFFWRNHSVKNYIFFSLISLTKRETICFQTIISTKMRKKFCRNGSNKQTNGLLLWYVLAKWQILSFKLSIWVKCASQFRRKIEPQIWVRSVSQFHRKIRPKLAM